MSSQEICDTDIISSNPSYSSVENEFTVRTKSERLDIRTKSSTFENHNKTASMTLLAERKHQLQQRTAQYEDLPANAQMRRYELSREYNQIIQDIRGKNSLIKELNKKLLLEYSSTANKFLLKSLHNALKSELEAARSLAMKAVNIQRKYPDQAWEKIPYNFDEEELVENSDYQNEMGDENRNNSIVSSVDPAARGDDDSQNFNIEANKINRTTKMTEQRTNISTLEHVTVNSNDFDCELGKFQKELACRDKIIEGLESKYVHLNTELSRMRLEHDKYVKVKTKNVPEEKDVNLNRDENKHYLIDLCKNTGNASSCKSSVSGSLHMDEACMRSSERKYTEVFEQQKSQKVSSKKQTIHNTIKKNHKGPSSQNKENVQPNNSSYNFSRNNEQNDSELNNIFQAMKNVFNKSASQRNSQCLNYNMAEFKVLQRKFADLQCELSDFRNIMKKQKLQLEDYHKKYAKSQQIIVSQRNKIEKLSKSNKELESEINCSLTQIREKFETKLKEVSHLPRVIQFEQEKLEKANKEKNTLNQKINILKNEHSVLKEKLAELSKKKTTSTSKLKTTERDLKIFRDQNAVLKTEKRKLIDELLKIKNDFEKSQSGNSKMVGRTKERAEMQRKVLLKKISDLQLELSQSRENTKSLIQQRDKIICEMQIQLNTLVHNFEVSQKHIRTLRKHIFSLSGNCAIPIPEKSTA